MAQQFYCGSAEQIEIWRLYAELARMRCRVL
jgi:hypothetical protein